MLVLQGVCFLCFVTFDLLYVNLRLEMPFLLYPLCLLAMSSFFLYKEVFGKLRMPCSTMTWRRFLALQQVSLSMCFNTGGGRLCG
jgi:hypothetical protein